MVDATRLRFSCSWTHARCYAKDGVRGWVGWGGDDNVRQTFAHMVDATQLRYLCSWTRARCYANDGVGGVGMVTFCQLAHIVDATHLRFLCPWTHARCYAKDGVRGVGWGGDDNVR